MRSLLASLCLLAPKSTGISFEIHNGSGNLPFAMSQGDRAVITSPRHALAPPSDMFPSGLVAVPFPFLTFLAGGCKHGVKYVFFFPQKKYRSLFQISRELKHLV